MKIHAILMLLSIAAVFVSCSEDEYSDIDYPLIILEPLFLEQETIEFLDFYDQKDKIVLRKLTDQTNHQSHQVSAGDSSEGQTADALWVFEKVKPLTTTFTKMTNTFRGNFEGEIESKEIIYKDNRNNSFSVEASTSAYIRGCGSDSHRSWGVRDQSFIISYDELCDTDYINHRIINNRKGFYWQKTIIEDEMEIGSKTYYNVMKLEQPSKFDHYIFYATKSEGLVMIEDVHIEETWVVAE